MWFLGTPAVCLAYAPRRRVTSRALAHLPRRSRGAGEVAAVARLDALARRVAAKVSELFLFQRVLSRPAQLHGMRNAAVSRRQHIPPPGHTRPEMRL